MPNSFQAVQDSRRPSLLPPAACDRYAAWAICGFLLLAVGLVFGQTIHHTFVNYDDELYVGENPHIAHGLTADEIEWTFTTTCGNLWAPLTWSSYILDFQLYGLKPWGYHFTNILLHAATTILLFLVLWRMMGDLWPGAFVAAVFAIHPLQVESAAWVAERKGLLGGLFFMLTLAAYLGYVRHRFSMVRYLTVVLLFALGLMAKLTLVTLPFVLLLLDYWPLRRLATKPRPSVAPSGVMDDRGSSTGATAGRGFMANVWFLVFEKLPLLAIAALSCLVAVWAQSQGQGLSPNQLLSPYWRVGNAMVSYVAYLGQMFYPAGLAIPYPRRVLDLPLWMVSGAFLDLAGITAAALVWRRKRPYLLVGWLWYLGMLLPAIGLIQFGAQATADRYTYLPQIGLCMVLAWGAAEAAASWPYRRWACGVSSAMVLTVLMACAWRQTTFWRESETLWTHSLDCDPRNALALCYLGTALHRQGRADEAVMYYRKSLQILPNGADALCNLGVALAERGQMDEAMAEYQKALEVKPDLADAHYNLGNALIGLGRLDEAIAHYQKALNAKPDYAHAHSNLGFALATQGQIDEAMAQYREALRIKPDFAEARFNLASALAERGRIDEAILQYQQGLKIKPDDAQAHTNLASALLQQGKMPEALAQRREVIRLCPNDVALLNDTAWMLATSANASVRNGAEAVALAQRAARLSGGREPAILGTLAAAYAEAGQFSDAVETARKALDLAAQQKKQALVESLKAKIPLYEAGTAFRDTQRPSTRRPEQP